MKRLLILPLLASVLYAESRYSSAWNFSADLSGTADARPETWGTAEVIEKTITFKPPTGQRVRILRAYGDFLIWPRCSVPQGKASGALLAFHTTAPDKSTKAQWAADNHMLYVQLATMGAPARAPYDFKTASAGLLEVDNTLVVKMAVWLNDTGCAIHMEPSFVLEYRFESVRDR